MMVNICHCPRQGRTQDTMAKVGVEALSIICDGGAVDGTGGGCCFFNTAHLNYLAGVGIDGPRFG